MTRNRKSQDITTLQTSTKHSFFKGPTLWKSRRHRDPTVCVKTHPYGAASKHILTDTSQLVPFLPCMSTDRYSRHAPVRGRRFLGRSPAVGRRHLHGLAVHRLSGLAGLSQLHLHLAPRARQRESGRPPRNGRHSHTHPRPLTRFQSLGRSVHRAVLVAQLTHGTFVLGTDLARWAIF